MLAERMIFTKNLYTPHLERKQYPPSVLLISDNLDRGPKIERFLLDNGCRVCRLDVNVDALATVCRNYFEVLLLDVQTPQTSLRAWQEIAAQPELSTMPIILLTDTGCSLEASWQLKAGNIYCLPHNAADDRLLTLIQQISYMLERYV